MTSEKANETIEHVDNSGELTDVTVLDEQLAVTEAEEKVRFMFRRCNTIILMVSGFLLCR
jgi:hypothetical protein